MKKKRSQSQSKLGSSSRNLQSKSNSSSRRFQSKFNSSSIKFQSKSNSSIFGFSKLVLNLYKGIFIRPFSSTCSRKVDPVGFVALSFATPYPASLLVNPIAGGIIILVGMASTLYLTTVTLPQFFSQDPSYAQIICRLENIFLLYDTYLGYERSVNNLLLANLDNFTLETLTNLYFSLQELVAVRESLFETVTNLINSPDIEFIEGPLKDRINLIHQDLRLGGNSLMRFMRGIEDILNIPADDRIPSF